MSQLRNPRATDTEATPSAAGRVAWADTAKGACIVLVVLWHVIMKHYLQIDWRISSPIPGAWGTLSEQLLPLRMPLFFTISGLFAAGAVSRPWRVLGRSRVAKFFYLYAVWLAIHTAVLSLVPDFKTDRAGSVVEFIEQLTITPSNLWYLLALAAYFTVAKAVRSVPATLVLGAAFALSAAASAGMLDVPGNRGGVYQNLLFFLAGLYGKAIIERLAATATWLRLAVVGVPYGCVLVLIDRFDAKTWFGLWPVTCAVAVVLGVTAAGLAVRWTALSKLASGIGRRTLPIYVLHMPLLALTHAALIGPLSAAGSTPQLMIALVEPLLLTTALTWFCLLLHRRLPATFLFDLPVLNRRPRQRRG